MNYQQQTFIQENRYKIVQDLKFVQICSNDSNDPLNDKCVTT